MERIARVTNPSPIPTPTVRTEEPVAVIPAASVAPLDGDADGERINTFILAPEKGRSANVLVGMRDRVKDKPFTYLVAAFSLGYVMARVMR